MSLIEMSVFVFGSGLKSSVKNTQHGLSVEEIRCLKTSSVQTKQTSGEIGDLGLSIEDWMRMLSAYHS